ncbi:DUF2306 domain-containing protein [Cohnella nanjingensis]|uniref:DUF2306 domain-containing protein n=1 Tax=Cohnella nanjingensis TaxID=1387779 RepID=A0A7X0RQY3_9BACL|nr:DUF2306 domain-containing protein [Cohnella nanjingensis]MBB6672072.1 DUF2306 domain-containing protein [Cohnella nanjingensis]
MTPAKRKWNPGWLILIVLFGGATGFAVGPYVLLDPGLSRVDLDPSFPLHFPLLLVHIFASFLALAVGWLQFLPALRRRRPGLHRLIGRIYLICVAIGGATGLVVGAFTESFIRQLAFLTLAALWLFTGWRGYVAIRRRQYGAHGLWMLRSYAVTLVAATARLITPLCILIFVAGHGGLPPGGVQAVVSLVLEVNIWLGLIVNLLLAEWVFAQRLRGD